MNKSLHSRYSCLSLSASRTPITKCLTPCQPAAAAAAAAAAAKSLQSCPTLCNPIDGSPSGSPVSGILQARTLEWVAISSSNVWKWKVKVKLLSCFQLLAIPWTVVYQAPPSMGFSRQEYWSGVPFPSPGETILREQREQKNTKTSNCCQAREVTTIKILYWL